MNNSGLATDANAGGATDTSLEGSTDTYKKGNNSMDGNNSNDSTSNRQTGDRNGQYLRSNPTVDTSNKVFKGVEPNIGCVLGLRFEKVDKNVAYDVFREKFTSYIGSNMKYGNKVVCGVKEYKDPMTDYE